MALALRAKIRSPLDRRGKSFIRRFYRVKIKVVRWATMIVARTQLATIVLVLRRSPYSDSYSIGTPMTEPIFDHDKLDGEYEYRDGVKCARPGH